MTRVKREWTNCQQRINHGFGHEGRAPKPGEMAFFCAACPQPDVNLPPEWDQDPEKYRYISLMSLKLTGCALDGSTRDTRR